MCCSMVYIQASVDMQCMMNNTIYFPNVNEACDSSWKLHCMWTVADQIVDCS